MNRVRVRTKVVPVTNRSVRISTTVSSGNRTTTRTKTVYIKQVDQLMLSTIGTDVRADGWYALFLTRDKSHYRFTNGGICSEEIKRFLLYLNWKLSVRLSFS